MSKQAKQAETFEEYVQIIREELMLEDFYKSVINSGEGDPDESSRDNSVKERRNTPRSFLTESEQ